MRSVGMVGAVLSLALLVACNGGTDASPSSGESGAVVHQSTSQGVTKYFNAVSNPTFEALAEAKRVSQPGSPAFAFASFLRGLAQARIDGGESDVTGGKPARKIDGGYKANCSGSQACYVFKNIRVVNGKVADFTLNGKPLLDHLTVGHGRAIVAGNGSSATFIGAFDEGPGGLLLIVVSLKAGSRGVGAVQQARYLASSGRQSDSSSYFGPSDLDPGALANFAFAFPKAKVGGTLKLTISDSNFSGNDSTLTIKTR